MLHAMTMEYGTITGRLVAAVADTTTDVDQNPDIIPITGTVTFTPSVKAILVESEDITVVPAPIVASLDSNGYVSLNGVRSVTVLATDSQYYNPNGWTYKVSFDNLAANGRRVTFDSYSIAVPAGETVDLSAVTPIPSSGGQAIARGPKGEPGNPGGTLVYDSSTGYYSTPGARPVPSIDPATSLFPRPVMDALSVVSAQSYAVSVAEARFGGVFDGVTDNTQTFKAAIAAAKGGSVYIPAGQYYGTFDLTGNPRFIGAGRQVTNITIAPGHYFVDANEQWVDVNVSGITFNGGSGALRNRFTGDNVTVRHLVADCEFTGYSVAAISHQSSDMPLWSIERCLFAAANSTAAIGIALAGLTDGSAIVANEFRQNRVHIKLGHGGNNVYVTNNDFIQSTAGTVMRAALWVVPSPDATNAGPGMTITANKFGNENLSSGDCRVLYADEGTGQYIGDKQPILSADSTGYVIGHTFRDNLVFGGQSAPFLYTTTRNIRGLVVASLLVTGTPPSYIVQVRTVGAVDPDQSTNRLDSITRTDTFVTPIVVTNQPGVIATGTGGSFDSYGKEALSSAGGQNPAGFSKLLSARINGFTPSSGVTRTQIADSVGGTDAAEFTIAGGEVVNYTPASALLADTTTWLEFDLQASATSPLSLLAISWGLDSSGLGAPGNVFRQFIAPTSRWTPYRFKMRNSLSGSNVLLKFLPAPGSSGTGVRIGRVRMYHSREPVTQNLVLPDAEVSSVSPAAGTSQALPATPSGYLTIFVNGYPQKIAYY